MDAGEAATDEVPAAPQALIRIVPGGGAKTAKRIRDQWAYLSRRGKIPLQRSERHLGVTLSPEQLAEVARSWALETGNYQDDQRAADSGQDLTTHIVVSFPPATDVALAFAIGRAWAEEMFGSGRNGGIFDYLTACHTDRAHPHMHLIVNRRALEGHWLKISRRQIHFNYERLRSTLVDVAFRFGIVLEATSRVARGILEQPLTYAEYRRRARKSKATDGRLPMDDR